VSQRKRWWHTVRTTFTGREEKNNVRDTILFCSNE
jgi:hypothetical protein